MDKSLTIKDRELLTRLREFLDMFPENSENFEDEWRDVFSPKETEQLENIFRRLLCKKPEAQEV